MIRVLVLSLICVVAQAIHADDVLADLSDSLPQGRMPAPNRVVSGGIDSTHMELLRRAGVEHIVSLRPAEETPGFDEAHAAAQHGLVYHSIPIRGAESLTVDNVRKLDRILHEIGDASALLHCSSGNRVGALIALREAWLYGRPVEHAIAVGREWGLTKLEPTVRELLEN
ncbi:MAG: sulfur transferase domain-containing protein [Gammaproteobacteria bacterium]|nr:hypothetical protein [Gammaproteobacteria bacterium]